MYSVFTKTTLILVFVIVFYARFYMSKCIVQGQTVWKLHNKQRNPKLLTLKMMVKDVYDWLMFNGLTALVDLQTHSKMMNL